MPELIDCPFCGGEAAHGKVTYPKDSSVARLNGQRIFYYISCVLCGASNQGLAGYKSAPEAAYTWNTRAPDPLREAVLWYFEVRERGPIMTHEASKELDMIMDKAEADLREMAK